MSSWLLTLRASSQVSYELLALVNEDSHPMHISRVHACNNLISNTISHLGPEGVNSVQDLEPRRRMLNIHFFSKWCYLVMSSLI